MSAAGGEKFNEADVPKNMKKTLSAIDAEVGYWLLE